MATLASDIYQFRREPDRSTAGKQTQPFNYLRIPHVSEIDSYEDAIKTLGYLYDKPKNEIFARHLLTTCKQTLDQFLKKPKSLAKACGYKDAKTQQIRDEAIRDSFISVPIDGGARQRLLERETLDLQKTYRMRMTST